MEKEIFRKKSLESITSPKQLNDYVRISSPGVMMILAGMLLVLAGFFFWCFFGRIETRVHVASVVADGMARSYITMNNIDSVEAGMALVLVDEEDELLSVSEEPVYADSRIPAYAYYIGEFQEGDWVYVSEARTGKADGVYRSYIIVESVAPISYIFPDD